MKKLKNTDLLEKEYFRTLKNYLRGNSLVSNAPHLSAECRSPSEVVILHLESLERILREDGVKDPLALVRESFPFLLEMMVSYDLNYHQGLAFWKKEYSRLNQLTEKARERESRWDEQLHLARLLQKRLIPEISAADGTPSYLHGLEVGGTLVPCQDVSGDFYDFIPMPTGEIGIVVADTVGKGVPAALLMVLTSTLLRSLSQEELNLTSLLKKVNETLYQHTEPGVFVDLCYLILSHDHRRLTYITAGGISPLLFRAQAGNTFTVLRTEGQVLGAFPDVKLSVMEKELSEDDVILIYTDGLIEQSDVKGRRFGENRLKAYIKGHKDLSMAELTEQLYQRMIDFSRRELSDDVTIIAIRKKAGLLHAACPERDCFAIARNDKRGIYNDSNEKCHCEGEARGNLINRQRSR